MPIFLITTYVYAIIGIEIFDITKAKKDHNPYDWTHYTDMNSITGAFLLLYQIIIGPKYYLILF